MPRFSMPLSFWMDGAGRALPGSKLYFYDAGTSTPKTTWSDRDMTVPNTNPVVANGSGYFGPIFMDADGYKVSLKDAAGVTIWTQDNIFAETSDGTITDEKIAISSKLHNRLADVWDIKDYGSLVSGDDWAPAIQAAIDHCHAAGGGSVLMPGGSYTIRTPIVLRSFVQLRGNGEGTRLVIETDISAIISEMTTASTMIYGAELADFYIYNTVAGARAKYDIHLLNPQVCKIQRIHIQSAHPDTYYSSSNVAGIWLDRPDESTVSCYVNRIDDCTIAGGSIYLRNVTDTVVDGGYIWAAQREFAVRVQATAIGKAGAIGIQNVVGIVPSKFKGGIWLDGPGINQIRVANVEFDGNPALDTGCGIYAPQEALAVAVTGCTFWGCDYQGIMAVDASSWSITGNNFYKCGARDDAAYDDIRLVSQAIPVNGCTVTGNTHLVDEARANPGNAVAFVSAGGGFPRGNVVAGNSAQGSYVAPPFLVPGNDTVAGNMASTGALVEKSPSAAKLAGYLQLGYDNFAAIDVWKNDIIAAGATLDLIINDTSSPGGNPGGAAGHLYVTSTRYDYDLQSRREIFTVLIRGTTAVITSLAAQNGAAGGSSYTVTVPANGVLRLTDTSGQQVAASMRFVGTRSLA